MCTVLYKSFVILVNGYGYLQKQRFMTIQLLWRQYRLTLNTKRQIFESCHFCLSRLRVFLFNLNLIFFHFFQFQCRIHKLMTTRVCSVHMLKHCKWWLRNLSNASNVETTQSTRHRKSVSYVFYIVHHYSVFYTVCICERIQLPQKWKKLNSKFHLTNNKYHPFFHFIFFTSIQTSNTDTIAIMINIKISISIHHKLLVTGIHVFNSDFSFNSISNFSPSIYFNHQMLDRSPFNVGSFLLFLWEFIQIPFHFSKWNRNFFYLLNRNFFTVGPTHSQFQFKTR